MSFKIPHKIRIKSRVSYEVVWVDRFDDPDCLGECRSEARQIAILKNQSEKATLETLLHEVLHAIEFEHDINIPHRIIYTLESALLRIIKLNSRLLKVYRAKK